MRKLNNISRRSILSALAVTPIAVAGVVAATKVGAVETTHLDADIFEKFGAYEKQVEFAENMRVQADDARSAAFADYEKFPDIILTMKGAAISTGRVLYPDEIEYLYSDSRKTKEARMLRDKRLAARERCVRQHSNCDAKTRRHELENLAVQALEEVKIMAFDILDTPANSEKGLIVKLMVWGRINEYSRHTSKYFDFGKSAFEDAKRLAGVL